MAYSPRWTPERAAARARRASEYRVLEQKRAETPIGYVEINGDTYIVRDKLRAVGAIWSPARKAWLIDPGGLEAARLIISTLAPKRRAAELKKLQK